MINLTKNALKFSLGGHIRIIMAFDEREGMLKVHVHDTGKGIREEDIPKLFSLFGKLRRTAELNHEGIGMGLMICQQLVRMNHGTIEVHSEGKNKGSVFCFSMQMKELTQGQDHEADVRPAQSLKFHSENSEESNELIDLRDQEPSKNNLDPESMRVDTSHDLSHRDSNHLRARNDESSQLLLQG